jgi:transcriptional regulator with GAF, ATPase, and Fis domain
MILELPNPNPNFLSKDYSLQQEQIDNLRAMGMEEQALIIEESLVKRHPEFEYKLIAQSTQEWLRRYITQDSYSLELLNKIRKLSVLLVDDPVLIQGETGTGKEILAQALHGRRKGYFIAVNCTSLPSELIESELFGHKKGAFTGAIDDRVGKIQAANGGTLFLDEIGDMPYDMQAKLLRVLQNGIIHRLGSNEDIKVKFRLVCATNRNLAKEHFREDLLYRLNTFALSTKALRERIADVPKIIEESLGVKGFPWGIDKWTEYCGSSGLRGNVREIQSIVRRWIVLKELPNI